MDLTKYMACEMFLVDNMKVLRPEVQKKNKEMCSKNFLPNILGVGWGNLRRILKHSNK